MEQEPGEGAGAEWRFGLRVPLGCMTILSHTKPGKNTTAAFPPASVCGLQSSVDFLHWEQELIVQIYPNTPGATVSETKPKSRHTVMEVGREPLDLSLDVFLHAAAQECVYCESALCL